MAGNQEEFDALRARIAALERPTRGRGIGAGRALFVAGLLAIAGCSLLVDLGRRATQRDQASTAARQEAMVAADTCDQAWARAYIRKGQRLGILGDMDVREDGVVALVSPTAWLRQPLDTQKTIAAAVDCSVAGKGNDLRAIHFRMTLSGPDLYGPEAAELLSLRRAGYAAKR